MPRLPYFHVDTFTNELYKGSPIGVCIVNHNLPDHTLQSIATENGLPETAFVYLDDYTIRWFTPTQEVDLCGVGCLASAYVIFNYYDKRANDLAFHSTSGTLYVQKASNGIQLNFPVRSCQKQDSMKPFFKEALGCDVKAVFKSNGYIAVLDSEESVKDLSPSIQLLLDMDTRGVMVTAAASQAVDFVFRYFRPRESIFEDPVTGSCLCSLVPYWAQELNKAELDIKQLSKRGGHFHCKLEGDHILIKGSAILYMKAVLLI